MVVNKPVNVGGLRVAIHAPGADAREIAQRVRGEFERELQDLSDASEGDFVR